MIFYSRFRDYPSVAPGLRWISFDLDGKLHSCPNRPLEPKTKQLIQNAMERMNATNTSGLSIPLNNIDIIMVGSIINTQ